MQITTLGPLAVDGRPVRGERLAAVVRALVDARGRAVSTALLVDAVWDGAPPDDAAGAVQALVSRVRRLGLPVLAVPGGYRLPADEVTVDAVAARALVERAGAALRARRRPAARAARPIGPGPCSRRCRSCDTPSGTRLLADVAALRAEAALAGGGPVRRGGPAPARRADPAATSRRPPCWSGCSPRRGATPRRSRWSSGCAPSWPTATAPTRRRWSPRRTWRCCAASSSRRRGRRRTGVEPRLPAAGGGRRPPLVGRERDVGRRRRGARRGAPLVTVVGDRRRGQDPARRRDRPPGAAAAGRSGWWSSPACARRPRCCPPCSPRSARRTPRGRRRTRSTRAQPRGTAACRGAGPRRSGRAGQLRTRPGRGGDRRRRPARGGPAGARRCWRPAGRRWAWPARSSTGCPRCPTPTRSRCSRPGSGPAARCPPGDAGPGAGAVPPAGQPAARPRAGRRPAAAHADRRRAGRADRPVRAARRRAARAARTAREPVGDGRLEPGTARARRAGAAAAAGGHPGAVHRRRSPPRSPRRRSDVRRGPGDAGRAVAADAGRGRGRAAPLPDAGDRPRVRRGPPGRGRRPRRGDGRPGRLGRGGRRSRLAAGFIGPGQLDAFAPVRRRAGQPRRGPALGARRTTTSRPRSTSPPPLFHLWTVRGPAPGGRRLGAAGCCTSTTRRRGGVRRSCTAGPRPAAARRRPARLDVPADRASTPVVGGTSGSPCSPGGRCGRCCAERRGEISARHWPRSPRRCRRSTRPTWTRRCRPPPT